MILCFFSLCLSVLFSHLPTLLVSYNFMYGSYHSRLYNDHERFCSQVVREIRSTHVHGFEQSKLDVIIDG